MVRKLPLFLRVSVRALLATALVALAAPVFAAPRDKVPDVANTKHNLSASGSGTVKSSESQICVFCHTPHGAESIPNAPLWNRKLSGASYTPYSSSSIEASTTELSQGPGGTSRLCLSCHDGTMALGSVNVLNGKANQTVTMAGTPDGRMPATGANTGFTRNLGVNLTNDHPISFTYNAELAAADGELRGPVAGVVDDRKRGETKPLLPLENKQMQCSTCHDPHLKETKPDINGVGKFLRANRLQNAKPVGGAFDADNDIFCLACHDKAGAAWAYSAHAHPDVANQAINLDATNRREFPTDLPVWRAACLACHDTHSVEGSRRLLREGTDSSAIPKGGGGSAIEETCYQCHSSSGETILKNGPANVPNIKDEFRLAFRMPITTTDQRSGGEAHDIGTGTAGIGGTQRGKDFYEEPARLGKSGNLQNRHVECTDCHNPHRVVKKRRFNENPTNIATGDAGTHPHVAGHTNIASGVLRGSYGVEPKYTPPYKFGSLATSFDVKRGDPGNGSITDTTVDKPYVTREYQVCMKCHSSYAYNKPPALQSSGGGTASGTNSMLDYTDQAMEFLSPSEHRGRPTRDDSGAYKGPIRSGCATPTSVCGSGGCTCYNVDFQLRNQRSWHPVTNSTGRDHTIRATSEGTWLAPWNLSANMGNQTMYCSDCHGSNTRVDSVDPNCTTSNTGCNDDGKPWGPHGSENPFILKGNWGSNVGSGGTGAATNALCFKCHNSTVYTSTGGGGGNTGFTGGGRGNLHAYHREKLNKIRCTWCHVAVPHGWKNRSFLVNLNDVGPEAGEQPGTQVRNNTRAAYTKGPYYLNAVLKIKTFGTSGSWSEGNCGSAGAPGNNQTGKDWMRDSSEACTNAP